MLKSSSFIIFAIIVFVCGTAATREGEIKADKQVRKLQETKLALETFEFHFNHILQKPFLLQTYGPLYREQLNLENFVLKEYININGDYNEEITDPDLLEEFKKVFLYFHASTPANTNINRMLANYHVTHIATWFKLNFQTCSLFHADVQEKENIRKNCERIAAFLETFTRILPRVQDHQNASFRKESPKNIKITEPLSSSQAELISERLKKVVKVEDIKDPDIEQCDKTKYCEIWIKKLTDQPKSFKLNHILFDVYNGLKESDYDVYDFESYTSDHDRSVTLWDHTPELLESAENAHHKSKKDKKITSYAVKLLFQIIDFKISEFGINPSSMIPIIPTVKYYTDNPKIFTGDEM